MSKQRAYSNVDWGSPINWGNPLTRGLQAWFLVVPNRLGYGSSRFRNLVGRNNGTLDGVNLATSWTEDFLDLDGVGEHIDLESALSLGTTWSVLYYGEVSGVATESLIGSASTSVIRYPLNTTQVRFIHAGATPSITFTAGQLQSLHSGGLTCDGIDTFRLYLNGGERGSATSVAAATTAFSPDAIFSQNQVGANTLAGRCNYFAAYNRTLSPLEISQWHDESSQAFPRLLNHIRRRSMVVPRGNRRRRYLTSV